MCNENCIDINSGRGYTRLNNVKPDFAVPGVNVTGALPGGRFAERSGSSIGTAIAAGASALLLEWLLEQEKRSAGYDTMQLKGLFILGARKRTDIHVYPGPSVAKRLDMAIDIALHTSDDKNPIDELRDRIGSGPAIAETVPTAIGIFIAERGDSMKCICDGVNIGDETSAIASIVGALCGTFRGSRSFPEDYLDFLNEQNGFDLELQAGAVLSACENLS